MLMLVFTMILLSIFHCNGDTCYCTCCICTVSSCASSSCERICQTNYPAQCRNGTGDATNQCRSSGSSTPNWVGDFIMAGRCNLTSCCCPTEQATLTRTTWNYLRIQSVFAGQCRGGISYFDQIVPNPTGYDALI
jgi:hypothetical protein